MFLNKARLALAKLAPKDHSRYSIQGICVNQKHTVVTDGHIIVMVEHPSSPVQDKDFPQTPGLETYPVTGNVLVSTEAALAALKALPKKSTIPVIQNAALGTDGKIFVNTLDSVQSFQHYMGGQYPNYEQVIPKDKPKAEVCLNADLLISVAKYIAENGDDRIPAMRLTIYDGSTAVRIDSKTASGEPIMALIMPLRYEAKDYAKRPDQETKPKAEPKVETVVAA